jgi:hypothetical protein
MKTTVILMSILFIALNLWAGPLDQLKALEGDWNGKFADGNEINVSYTTISGGNAVMETFRLPDGTDMRSIYHMNGERLMMTHYCESGNQPRLQSTSSANGNDVTLNFLDITNLGEPKMSSYLYRVVFHFGNKDQISQDITWMMQGKESTNKLTLVRKK